MTEPAPHDASGSPHGGGPVPRTSWAGRVGLALWAVGTIALLAVGAGALSSVESRWRLELVIAAVAAWGLGVVLRLRWRR